MELLISAIELAVGTPLGYFMLRDSIADENAAFGRPDDNDKEVKAGFADPRLLNWLWVKDVTDDSMDSGTPLGKPLLKGDIAEDNTDLEGVDECGKEIRVGFTKPPLLS